MTWNVFIEKLLKEFRLSENELANMIDMSQAAVNKWRKSTSKKPYQNTIRKIEKALNIRIDDSDPTNISFIKFESDNAEAESDNNGTYIAHLKVANTIPAGISEINEVFDEHTKEYRFDSNNHIYLQIDENNGDSLAPIVQPGDYVIIDLSNSNPRNNDIAAVKWKDNNGKIQYAVKIYNQIEGGVLLTSTNINVPPKMISHQQVLAKYKVIGIWKDN